MIGEVDLLKWIAEEGKAQYGECYGETLGRLIAKGEVEVLEGIEHQSGFIARGSGEMYRAVVLTEAGRERLRRKA